MEPNGFKSCFFISPHRFIHKIYILVLSFIHSYKFLYSSLERERSGANIVRRRWHNITNLDNLLWIYISVDSIHFMAWAQIMGFYLKPWHEYAVIKKVLYIHKSSSATRPGFSYMSGFSQLIAENGGTKSILWYGH
ncbi:hypothetical protein QTP88_014207 [Uroleucon formosanum]